MIQITNKLCDTFLDSLRVNKLTAFPNELKEELTKGLSRELRNELEDKLSSELYKGLRWEFYNWKGKK